MWDVKSSPKGRLVFIGGKVQNEAKGQHAIMTKIEINAKLFILNQIRSHLLSKVIIILINVRQICRRL